MIAKFEEKYPFTVQVADAPATGVDELEADAPVAPVKAVWKSASFVNVPELIFLLAGSERTQKK